MIRINQCKLNIHHTDKELEDKICRMLKIKSSELVAYYIVKRALDARKKTDIRYSYTIQAEIKNEDTVLARNKDSNITKDRTVYYEIPENGK